MAATERQQTKDEKRQKTKGERRKTNATRLPSFAFRLAALSVAAWLMIASPAVAQGPKPKADEGSGGFVKVSSPITSGVVSSVRRHTETLLHESARVVVFEIEPGKSEYEYCLKLARYISSIQGAKTVAYVPKPLTGHAVLVAISADELVMASNASIGDAGSDEKFIEAVMRTGYSDLAERRRLPHKALILGMLDKELEVWEVRTAEGKRYVLESDLEKVEKVIGKDVVILKGQFGVFDGDRARSLGLAQLLAESRQEVAAAYGLPPKSAIETARVGVEWRPVRMRIDGFVGPLMQEYVRRHVKEQLERGKNFFIFEIDSLGGLAFTGLELAESIADMKGVKTVAYIPKDAISAGAFIALGCDEIVMHRNATLGDCGVMFQEGGQFHYVPEKERSILDAKLETLAKAKGWPVALTLGFVDKDLVVRQARDPKTGRTLFLTEKELNERAGDNLGNCPIVKDKEKFLTMNGEEAERLGFAGVLVDSFDGLRAIYGLEDVDVTIVNPNWVDTLIVILNSRFIAALLLVGGILGLYLEVKMPGVTLPGLFGALCFLLFFWSKFMGGTATALEIVLFLAGALCLGLEIFVIPGFGVFGVTGILLMICSIILASQTFVFPQGTREWRELAENLGSVVFAFMCMFAFAFVVGKYLPSVPLLGRVVLLPDQGLAGPALEAGPFADLVGSEGTAMSTLRPAGRVRFGDEYVDVVTDGSYIEAGSRVRVIEVLGNRVVVKQV